MVVYHQIQEVHIATPHITTAYMALHHQIQVVNIATPHGGVSSDTGSSYNNCIWGNASSDTGSKHR